MRNVYRKHAGWIAAMVMLAAATVTHGQILVFQAPATGGANAASQNPSSIAANISVDGLQRINAGVADGGNILYKSSTAAWGSTHWASAPGSGAYAGSRSDTGYVFTVTAATGYTFDLTSATYLHRATAAGPATVGIKIGSTQFAGTGTSVSTTVDTYNSGALGLTGLTAATFIVQGWDSGGTGNGEFQMNNLQVFGSVNAAGSPPANNNSVLSIAASSAFGRVMADSSQNVALSNTGDATTYSSSATGEFTSTATGAVTEDGSTNISVQVGATLGNRSGVLSVNNTALDSAAAGQGSDQPAQLSNLSATVVQNRVLDAASVAATTEGGIDLGRQMLGTVTGTHQVTSTGADAENTRLTFSETASNTFAGYEPSGLAEIRATNADATDVVMDGTTTMNVAYEFDFTQTGTRDNDDQYILFNTGNGISGEGLTGETVLGGQPNAGQLRIYIQNATIVENREIDASSVDLGSVLVGATTASQDTNLTTSGDDEHRTRVTVDGTQVSSGGVTITAGAAQLFDEATDTTTRSITGNFATSGSKNVDVNFDVTGEGLAGESVNPVMVTATANVYQAASLSANNASALGDSVALELTNAATSDGGQRAAAEVVSRSVTGDGWSVTGLTVGTTVAENAMESGTSAFDGTGLLNGVHLGVFELGLQHADQSIGGTSTNDLGSVNWNLSATVTGNTGDGSASLFAGQSFDSFNTSRGSGSETQVGFLGGTASTDLMMQVGFGDAPPEDVFSDVVTLTGLNGERFVLSLSYDPSLLPAGVLEEQLFLGWFDTDTEAFVNAVLGNIGPNEVLLDDPYQGSWLDYQADTGLNISTALGAYGVDVASETVWAVLNHNSDFAVVPEPGSVALLLAGSLLMLGRRRKEASKA